MPRTLRRWRLLKTPPAHLGSAPGGPPERYPHRTMVAGRGARGPEQQDRPPLGKTRHPAPRPARSANEFGLHLRSDLPATGQGRSLGAAPMRHAGHEPALGRGRTSRGSRSPWGHADGPGRMAPRQGPRRAGQPHAGAAARPSARIEPGREYLAVSARQLVVEPRVRLLPRHRRSLLLRVEPPHRPALAHHVHRPPRLGQCMRISAGWYQALVTGADRGGTVGLIASYSPDLSRRSQLSRGPYEGRASPSPASPERGHCAPGARKAQQLANGITAWLSLLLEFPVTNGCGCPAGLAGIGSVARFR